MVLDLMLPYVLDMMYHQKHMKKVYLNYLKTISFNSNYFTNHFHHENNVQFLDLFHYAIQLHQLFVMKNLDHMD